MGRPDSIPAKLPTPEEVRNRRAEMEWLYREPPLTPREPETKKPGTQPGSDRKR
jgi:hypothetical protein